MYNIIHLLKCSSPALAQHFEESENSLKKLNEISVDFEKRLNNLEGRINDALSSISKSKRTVVLTYDFNLPQEYDTFISERFGKIATGEANSDDDDIHVTLIDYELNLIKNAYFLVFRSSDRAVIYYNNDKMGRDTTQMEYYCMDNEIGRKVLINPTTRVMKLVRTGV